MPAARTQGLGVAVAGSVPVAGRAVVAAGGRVLGLVQRDAGTWSAVSWRARRAWPPLVAVLLLVWRCVRRLGGVTGDVMGAAIEIALTIMLVGVAV